MTKLIESTTTETLPSGTSGTTITTLHLTPEAKRGLSTGGALIPAPNSEPPSADKPRIRDRLRLWWWWRGIHLDCAQWQLALWHGRPAPLGACTRCLPRMEKIRAFYMPTAKVRL